MRSSWTYIEVEWRREPFLDLYNRWKPSALKQKKHSIQVFDNTQIKVAKMSRIRRFKKDDGEWFEVIYSLLERKN